MTRKKCIKILMNTVAESRYREAADLFTRSREAAQQVHVNVSNKELLGSCWAVPFVRVPTMAK